jgi:hypothetical protein
VERVAFLIEESNERLPALLNPESFVIRRLAGVRSKRSSTGQLTGAGLTDDPLLFTGGGTTELEFNLLFDVSLAGSSITTDDVRDLTRPLWNLAENMERQEDYWHPPLVRFIWGKSWNILGSIVAVAERLERFTGGGNPRRSWLSMRMLRVDESVLGPSLSELLDMISENLQQMIDDLDLELEGARTHEILGGSSGGEGAVERLDEISFRYFGDPGQWRLVAGFNDVDDPMRMPPGSLLRIPPVNLFRR